jgi:hypothetical protein
MALEVEDSIDPARVTDHVVPDGNPDSEKVTMYSRALEEFEEPAFFRPGMTPVKSNARITIAMTTIAAIAIPVFFETLPFRGAGCEGSGGGGGDEVDVPGTCCGGACGGGELEATGVVSGCVGPSGVAKVACSHAEI